MEIFGLSTVWSIMIIVIFIVIIVTLIVGALNTKIIVANQKTFEVNRQSSDLANTKVNVLLHGGYIFTYVNHQMVIFDKNKTMKFANVDQAWSHYVAETNAKHKLR